MLTTFISSSKHLQKYIPLGARRFIGAESASTGADSTSTQRRRPGWSHQSKLRLNADDLRVICEVEIIQYQSPQLVVGGMRMTPLMFSIEHASGFLPVLKYMPVSHYVYSTLILIMVKRQTNVADVGLSLNHNQPIIWGWMSLDGPNEYWWFWILVSRPT